MPEKRQVWCLENAVPPAVLRGLRRRFVVKLLRDFEGAAAKLEGNGRPAAPLVCLADRTGPGAARLAAFARKHPNVRAIAFAEGKPASPRGGRGWFAEVPKHAPADLVERLVEAAFEQIESAERERAALRELDAARLEMQELAQIGVALSAERDIDALLRMILRKAREITGADAGSLYLVEEDSEGRRLRFRLTQNDSRDFPFIEFTIPITENSMAGFVALHGEPLNLPDAYAIPPAAPYRFNPHYDEDTGYRTRSMLTLPMKDARSEVTGVIQLINCKRNRGVPLSDPGNFDREVQPFPEHAVQLALSLASQAAVAYENSKLYADIESLFEGFVSAAVTAIEQRDPATSGHSSRVSTLTTGLAETVDRASTGPYAGERFSREQMKELRYAALLHDFGKVGVREQVLVKAKKLYPQQLDLVRQRFDYIRKEMEARVNRRKLDLMMERIREEALVEIGKLDEEYRRRLEEIDDYFQFILQVNEPTILEEGNFDRLVQLAQQTFADPRGITRPFLTVDEVRLLSIPRGSLDPNERREIESHVVHTFNFLQQIPWTRELSRVPDIARAHHEKLDGTGYPYKLRGSQIPLPTKMMTICDIFDALSAADRPYKKAVPVERALEILETSVRDNELDSELFRLFLDAKIFQRTVRSGSR